MWRSRRTEKENVTIAGNERTRKDRTAQPAGPWKAEMSTKSVKETRLETTCTHHFQFLSVAKDEVNRRKGMVIKIFGRRKRMHVLGKYGGNSRFYSHLTNRILKEKTT